MKPNLRFLLLSALLVALPRSALAGKFYLDFGWGKASISKAGPILGTDASLSMADAINTSMGYDFAEPFAGFKLGVALHGRLLSGESSSGRNLGIATVLPLFRVSYKYFTLGTGASPFVWNRSGGSFNLQGFSRNGGSISILGELGVMYPFTPEFALTASSGLLWAQTGLTLAPAPAWDIQLSARIHFGNPNSSRAGNSTSDYNYAEKEGYQGWRYPFGKGR